MKKKIMKQPVQPKLAKVLTENAPTMLEHEEMLTNFQIDNYDYRNQDLNYVALDSCHLVKTSFSNSTLRNFEVQDTIFEHCDFSNTEMFGAGIHRTIFKNCKLTGANFAESILQDCQFIDCIADFSGYSYATLKIVSFSGCSLKEADFFDLTWQHLQLTQSNLDGSSWFNTSLADLNWASCQFDKLAFSPDCLAGLTINQEQAITIATVLGVTIDEPI